MAPARRLVRPALRVAAVWALLSGFAVVVALGFATPLDVPGLNLYTVLLVPLALAAYLAWRSFFPILPFVALVLFVLGIVDVLVSCPGVACDLPAGYDHWAHLSVYYEQRPLPALAVTTEPPRCRRGCVYSLDLLQTGVAYGLFGWTAWRAAPGPAQVRTE